MQVMMIDQGKVIKLTRDEFATLEEINQNIILLCNEVIELRQDINELKSIVYKGDE